jgi:diguanylate cyclase (GGDEF)-like protein/PAS domain S-box-containing protein
MTLHGTYDYRMVAFSVVIATFAAYAAFELAGRVAAAGRGSQVLWLTGGATSLGLGIWAMHYIGMLAFRLPVPVVYDYPTVVLSLLAAMAASAVALFTVSRENLTVRSRITASFITGGGIAAMHYMGMAAMRLPAMMEYQWSIVALSVVVAVGVSLAAIVLAFQLRQEKTVSRRKLLSALLMGSAIPLTHYTGMWAVTFHASNGAINLGNVVSISSLGVVTISCVTFAFLAAAIATSFLDRMLAAQRAQAVGVQENELYFRTLAEVVPQMIWTATPDGALNFASSQWTKYTGMSVEETLGWGWEPVLHPDDLAGCLVAWKECLKTGETFQFEYRFRRASDQVYRWFLGRAKPIRDEKGQIVEWFGTCTDIEDQKRNTQILEEQIKLRTEELADSHARLKEEMVERDQARRELDEQNQKMMQDLTARTHRATMLAKMGELLQSCLGRDEVFAAALGFGPKIFPTSRGAMALLNVDRTLVEVSGQWQECRLPMTVFEPSACWALRTGHPHLVVAGDTTARCAHADGVEDTYLCIPILAQGEALGILHFQATDENPAMAGSELSLKTTFAGQVGLSVANLRLREALRAQSIRDPLTGLYNRRYLTEMLEREIRRAVRAEQSLGVLMLDLDHFKKFNDTYGHDAGDSVLREAALFLSKSIRMEDTLCRFGGEEFVILLPTADLESSRARAERIRTRLRELTVLHRGLSLGMITVSVGVSALPEHGTSAKDLLGSADAALYRAKKEGRDRVVKAEPLPANQPEYPIVEMTKT